MDAIDYLISIAFQRKHGVSQEVPSSSLNGGLEDATSDERVTTPLPRISILGMHCNAELFAPPWSGEQLELWPLPADEPT